MWGTAAREERTWVWKITYGGVEKDDARRWGDKKDNGKKETIVYHMYWNIINIKIIE